MIIALPCFQPSYSLVCLERCETSPRWSGTQQTPESRFPENSEDLCTCPAEQVSRASVCYSREQSSIALIPQHSRLLESDWSEGHELGK